MVSSSDTVATAASGPCLHCQLLHLRTMCMGSSGSIQLCCWGCFRAPPTPDGTGPGACVGARAQQAQRGIKEPRLSHPRLPASTRRDAVAPVLLEVAVQVIRAHKSFKAARALIGPQAGVYAHVVLQIVVVSKGGPTLCTQVRLLSCVLPHMNLELVLPVKEKYKQDQIRTQTKCKSGSAHSRLNTAYTVHTTTLRFSFKTYVMLHNRLKYIITCVTVVRFYASDCSTSFGSCPIHLYSEGSWANWGETINFTSLSV